MLPRSLALIVAALLGGGAAGGVARAQPATMPDEPRFPDVLRPPPGFDRDPAWALYDEAFRDAAAGDVERARERLDELAARWPAHPARARAAALIARLSPRRDDPDAPSNVAGGELVFWSTLGGVALAANLCVAIDCSSDREDAGVYTLTVGTALGLSFFAARRGVRHGQAQLYNSAQTWGAWNALLLNDGFPDTAGEASVAIATQVAGLATGIGVWQTWRPSQGDVALTNTFLLWGSVLTIWGHVIADSDASLRTVILAGDLSLLVGALAARSVDVSRGRTFLIDVGGILGTLGGGLIALATDSNTGAGISLMVGTGAGLAIAVATTRDWDAAPAVKVTPAVIPGPDRSSGYGLMAGFSF